MSVTALKWEARDRLHRMATHVGGHLLGITAAAFMKLGLERVGLKQALLAYRLSFSNWPLGLTKLQLQKHGHRCLLDLASAPVSTRETAKRTLVLRWPHIGSGRCLSKGIILIKFTTTFSYFHHNIDVEELQRYFHIVLEPSWAGYADPDILLWGMYSQPVFVQAAEYRDRAALMSLAHNLIPLSLGSGSWVDYRKFDSMGEPDRPIDAIYVANTNPIKRIHVFLKALSTLKMSGHKDFRAVLVCASWGGGSAAEIERLVADYDVTELCTVYHAIPQAEVSKLLRQSKSCLLLSLKEGSNRSLYEAMFCDTPVIALAENIGVDKQNINCQTGMLIYEDALAEALLHIKNHWDRYEPREWARNNISPDLSTEELLSAIRVKTGDTCGPEEVVMVKTNSPEAQYRDVQIKHETYSKRLLAAFDKTARPVPQSLCPTLAQLSSEFKAEISAYIEEPS